MSTVRGILGEMLVPDGGGLRLGDLLPYSPAGLFGTCGLGDYQVSNFVAPKALPALRYRFSRYASRDFRTDRQRGFKRA